MKTQDKNVDELIREALNEEERVYYDQLEEENLIQQFGGLFKGKMAIWTVVTTIMIFAMIGLIVYAMIQFMNTESTRMMILWSMITIASFISIGLLKMWNWMQMDKHAILREMKRLQFEMVALLEKGAKTE